MITKIKITTVLLFQLLFYFGLAQNQEIKFNLITDPNGNSIGLNAIGQDPYGYMWFAAQPEKCIYRYDGNRFVVFRHDDNNLNSLGVGTIETMFVDADGMIWIGGNGLDRYNPKTETFTHFRHKPNKNSLADSYIFTILKDHHGRLWVGTDKGLDCMDVKTGKFTHFNNEPGNVKSLSSNFIWRLYEDRQGVVWIATGAPFSPKDPEDGGLNRYNEDGSFTRYLNDPKDPNSLANNRVAAMFEDNHGVFWVGTKYDGLQTMDRKTGIFEHVIYKPVSQLGCPPPKSAKKFNTISFITGDSTGGLWIGMLNSGMYRYDPDTKKTVDFEHCNGYPDSSSWCAYTSREGEFWLASVDDKGSKLFKVDPLYKPINKVQIGVPVNNYMEDMDGNLWIGTFGKGLLKYNHNNNLIQQFKPDPAEPSGIPDSNISALFQDHKNILWVGSFGGLRILNTQDKKFTSLQEFKPLKDSAGIGFSKIIKDKQGILWFTTWGMGLKSFNPKNNTYQQFLSINGDSTTLSSNNLNNIVIDKVGRIWVSGQGGVNRLIRETGHFKQYLPETLTWYIYEDSDGSFWAGTEKGLFRYDEKEDRFASFFDPASDLYSQHVGGIIEDQTKQLWLNSRSAIIRLNPSTRETNLYAINYGIKQGSLAPWASPHIDSKGRLYFGYDSGFYVFSPKDLEVITKMNIIITDLFVNSLPASVQKIHLEKNIEEIRELTLAYNQNNIAFNFSAIYYKAPELTRYSTMLENYDNTWREVKTEKSAAYYNIQPGHYVFHIKAFNSEGVKAEKILDVQILPPWWKTWWAYTLYGLLFLSAIYLVYRVQKQRIIQKERQKQQSFELAQAKEIEKAYHELRSTQAQLIQSEKMASLGELTAGIAHEIQNPLNFVNNFSDVNTELIDEAERSVDEGNNQETRQLLQNIRENEVKIKYHGQRADAIVKSMLQHSRTSTGQKEPTDINSLADEYLRLSFHGLRAKDKTFNVTLKTDFDSTIGNIKIIPQDIGRVLLNLYNNAFYAVMEKKQIRGSAFEPMVWVSTKKTGNKILLSVKDNGKGIPKQVMDKIFQPFFTTKPTGQGTGLGLSLSYDIVKSHGGEITVESFPDKEDGGTIFTIELPVL